MFNAAKQRVKGNDLSFTITEYDILNVWPKDNKCPYLGIELKRSTGKASWDSPTLDRIIPELGYVPDNIEVISHKANTIKQNVTDPEVFFKIGRRLQEILALKTNKIPK